MPIPVPPPSLDRTMRLIPNFQAARRQRTAFRRTCTTELDRLDHAGSVRLFAAADRDADSLGFFVDWARLSAVNRIQQVGTPHPDDDRCYDIPADARDDVRRALWRVTGAIRLRNLLSLIAELAFISPILVTAMLFVFALTAV